ANSPAVANDFEWNLDPRRTTAPNLAIEIAQTFDLRSADAGENIAAADSRFGGRAPFSNARDDDFIAIFGRKDAKPRACRLVDPAVGEQIVEDRRQKVDRHDHIDVARAALLAELLDVQ